MTKKSTKHGGARRGAGRKTKADEQAALDLMNEAWPASRRKRAVQKMAREAEAGNVKAYMALMAYAYGKPKETHEHQGSGGGPVVLKVVYGK